MMSLVFTCVEILCGGGDVPVFDTLPRIEEDGERLSNTVGRGGDVPVDFF